VTIVYMIIRNRTSIAIHFNDPVFSMLASHESSWLIPGTFG
jgi:hypothetical protein